MCVSHEFSYKEEKRTDTFFREQNGPGPGHDRGRGRERNAAASINRQAMAYLIFECHRGVRGGRGNQLDDRNNLEE